MEIRGLKKSPCSKCPYTRGLMHTVINPCPQCKLNGYQMYQWFRRQLSGKCTDSWNNDPSELKISAKDN